MDYHRDRFTDASVLAMNAAGRVLALFPANRSGERLSSHAGLSYGGMVSDVAMTSRLALEIFAAWFKHFREQGIAEIVYKAVPPIYHPHAGGRRSLRPLLTRRVTLPAAT